MVAKKREERTLWRGKPLPDGYEKDLERIVDMAFDEAHRRDWSWGDLARFAGLNHHTVWRLGERITRAPSMLTVWKLMTVTQIRITGEKKRPNVLRDRGKPARQPKAAG